MKNLPDKITYSRFLFSLLALYFAYSGNLAVFLLSYSLALITDIADGFFARKLKRGTKFGAKLDIIADNFMLVCVMLGVYLLKPSVIRYWRYFAYILIYFVAIQLLSIIKAKRPIFRRTFAANSAALFFPVVVLAVLFYEAQLLIKIYSLLMLFSLTEKIFLEFDKKKRSTVFSLKPKKAMVFLVILALAVVPVFLFPVQRLVCFDNKCIEVEVMDTPEKRALGLMFRQRITNQEGMLFLFDEPRIPTFWMMNVQFSIDIIFVDENLTVEYIVKEAPPCYKEPCERYSPEGEVLYVVEAIKGFSDKFNVTEGQKIRVV